MIYCNTTIESPSCNFVLDSVKAMPSIATGSSSIVISIMNSTEPTILVNSNSASFISNCCTSTIL